MSKTKAQGAFLFLTGGIGDNLLCLPLALELGNKLRLKIVVITTYEYEFYKEIFGASCVFLCKTKKELFTLVPKSIGFNYWLFPVSSSTRRFRLLHVFAPWIQTMGFTSYTTEKTWQGDFGFKYCLMPDLGKKSWKNQLRLFYLIFPKEFFLNKTWENYMQVVLKRLNLTNYLVRDVKSVAIHAGSNKYMAGLEKYKRWPIDRYFDLIKELKNKTNIEKVYWLIGPGEDDIVNEVKKYAKENSVNEIIFCNKKFNGSILQLLRFLSEVDYFIGNDSGISHLASITGIPMTVLVTGIGQVLFTGQNGIRTQLLWEDVECKGCCVGMSKGLAGMYYCPFDAKCMKDLTLAKITKEVSEHILISVGADGGFINKELNSKEIKIQ